MTRRARPTTKDVRRVARRTIEILEGGNYECAVFGSLACSVWGMDRTPGDVDIVVMGEYDREAIKAYIASRNDRFSLEDAKTPGADYKVLYFNLNWALGLKCKVDILTTGPIPLHIPEIPQGHIVYPNGYNIPVVPLLVLLILKVQGWRDHRRSRKKRFRAKIPQDIEDISWLLVMADDANDRLYELELWAPNWFMNHADNLVTRYTNRFQETYYPFRDLGFNI